MLLIPLGFGRKIPRVPYLTLAIALIVLGVSLPYFGLITDFERLKETSMKTSGYDQKLVAFARLDCAATGLRAEACKTLERMLEASFADDSSASREVQKQLSTLSSSLDEMERVGRVYARLLGDPRRFTSKALDTPEYAELLEARATVDDEMRPIVRAKHFLTSKHLRADALMLAQWLHVNWAHLIGNMLVFLLFGAILEARLGPGPLAVIYIAGGTLGLGVQSVLLHDPLTILVGASANVSAVIGAFFVYFFQRPMRVLFTLIVFNRFLEVPTWLVVSVMFVAGDIAGALDGGGSVAHLAHLIGFITGAGLAWIFKSAENLDAAYLYPTEYDWHVEMRAAVELDTKLVIADRILSYNTDNYLVRLDAIEAILFGPERGAGRGYLETALWPTIELGLRRRDLDRIDRILHALPSDFSFIRHLPLSQRALLTLSSRQLRDGHWFVALRLYDVFRYRYPKASTAHSIASTVQNLLEHLRGNHAELSILNAYLVQEQQTTLIDLVAEYVPATDERSADERSG